jgi:hypothetical protein
MVAPVNAMPVGAVVVSVPPQTVAEELATVKPVGSVSVKATPVRDTAFAAGLVVVNVSEVVAFSAIAAGLNALAIDGGATTLRVAVLLGAPVPPSVELTAPVVLALAPAVVPVTFTENVQEPLAAIVPPVRLTVPEPATAVMVPLPQVPVRPFGVETTRPVGKVSLNATPVAATAVVFWIVKLRLVEPFSGIEAAPNALLIVGGPTTVMLALDVLPVPLSVAVTVTLLFFTPPVVPVMFTLNVHEAVAARVAPERLTEVAPAVAVIVPPPQDPVRPFGVETTRPAGKLSVNATPVNDWLAFGLLIVKLSEVLPPTGMLAAPNDLVMAGGVATLKFAVAVLPVPPFVEVTAPVVFVN